MESEIVDFYGSLSRGASVQIVIGNNVRQYQHTLTTPTLLAILTLLDKLNKRASNYKYQLTSIKNKIAHSPSLNDSSCGRPFGYTICHHEVVVIVVYLFVVDLCSSERFRVLLIYTNLFLSSEIAQSRRVSGVTS